ncbi:hypothetical protein E4U52_008052 [Claviceps spartinae]|nr:hypothetical protein E4U52_008052 [Claviceps spartinae]
MDRQKDLPHKYWPPQRNKPIRWVLCSNSSPALRRHEKTLAPASMLPARKALPFNHIFDGDKTMFKSWHTAITSKLRSESAFISNHEQQWLFINEMLPMKVWRRVAVEYSNGLAVKYNPAAGSTSTSTRRRPIASEPS